MANKHSDKRNPKWCVNFITDSFRSRPNHWNDHPEDIKRIQGVARKYGINPEAAHYVPALARFPGDPEAFVSSKSEIKQLIERRGWKCEGVVEVDALKPSQPKPYEVADDIVEREVEEIVQREYGGKISQKKRRELFEQIKEKRSGNRETVDRLGDD